jgi:hypothetical protein
LRIDADVALDRSGRGEQAQAVAAFGQQPVDQHLVDALRGAQRLHDALRRIEVEVEPGGAESEVEIGDHRIDGKVARHEPADMMGDGARADAALGADESLDRPTGAALGSRNRLPITSMT